MLKDVMGWKVEKWRVEDNEGKVYGMPCDVEMDVVVENGKRILIEIKSSVSTGDVGAFKRIIELYESIEGPADRKLLISPYTYPVALEMAKKLGIEIFRSQSL